MLSAPWSCAPPPRSSRLPRRSASRAARARTRRSFRSSSSTRARRARRGVRRRTTGASPSMPSSSSSSTTAPPLVGDDPFALEDIEERLEDVDGADRWQGRARRRAARLDRQARSACRCGGCSASRRERRTPRSRSASTPSRARATARGAPSDFRALKVKVGGAEDLERLEAVREEAPGAAIRVDANEGWTLDAARELMPELIALGVEFVEQPFPAADIDSFNALKRAAPAPAGRHRRGLPEPCRTWPPPPPTPTASTSSSPSPAACARLCG